MQHAAQGPVGQGLVRTNYRVRTVAFLWCLLVFGLYQWERGAGALAWTAMLLTFLAVPHLLYWRAMLSPRPTHAELDNLLLDAVIFGVWVAELGFPTWITYCCVGATTLNAVINRGPRGLAASIACTLAGVVLWTAVRGLHYSPETSDLVTWLCFAGAVGYTAMVGYSVYRQTRRLSAARDALRREEERYRLIAENAADLIAMVDHDGRWLYTSPSYSRILERDDLQVGADAFRRYHPDDAEKARAALLRASVGGKPRDVALRMVDKQGRVRQYKTRLQALGGPAGPRLILISQDVTDLRESEEQVLLAGHAFEGLTEAIVITSADGTIVTVNRAFCDLTGYVRDEILGASEKDIRNALQAPEYYDEIFATVKRDGSNPNLRG
jgi:PAS domain S-box-containing protein